MTDVRVTQASSEVLLSPARPTAKVTQTAVEVLHDDTSPPPAPPYSEDPGSIRVTQSGALAMIEGAAPDIRTTQAAVMVMYEPGPPVRITQAEALILAEFDADMRITQTAALVLAHRHPCLVEWAQTWTITRLDGEVFGFTDHDQPVNYFGVSHVPCNSMMSSALQLSTIVGNAGSLELKGILSDSGISEIELYNGLFDGAKVEINLVPWGANTNNDIPTRLISGTTGNSTTDETSFSQEIISDQAKLQQSALIEHFSPDCPYEFGNEIDPRCPVSLAALKVSGSVTATAVPVAFNNSARRIFTDSTRVEADRTFNTGRITWLTGANAGAVSQVKDFAAGTFVLWEALLYPIALSDTYEVTPRCGKSPADHLLYNADMTDFGGYPHIPGTDRFLKTPDAKG